ncbi:MAG TPA: MltA domain-containing protein [Candidatus Binatia bacterium]|nr:MltA domain-containing protein [Candidatus Binatia bacterium]
MRAKHQGLVCALVLVFASGCYGIRVTVTAPPRPAYKVAARPTIAGDDLALEGLRAAAEASKRYYASLGERVYFSLDRDTYSSEQLSRSMDYFLRILDDTSARRLDQRIARECRSYRPRRGDGHFTAYFEPVLRAKLRPDERYRYPVYAKPDDLTLVELGRFFPGDARTINGVVRQGELFPYLTREEIDGRGLLRGRGLELAWVDDPVELFFLHSQGSGRLDLVDGGEIRVNFAGSNGLPYTSIARHMIDNRVVDSGSNAEIRHFLTHNPEQRDQILFRNRRYIFFRSVELDSKDGPVGSLGQPLIAGRSLATDQRYVPPGALMYIKTRRPVLDSVGNLVGWEKIGRFAFSHDTGAAIKGPGRGDIFWGAGERAGSTAGYVNERGDMIILVCGVQPLPGGRPANAGEAYTRVPWDGVVAVASLQ